MVAYVVIGLLAAAVGVLTYVVYSQAKSATDPSADETERQINELMAAQQALVGKVDAVSQAQVSNSKALTDSLSENQKKMSDSLNLTQQQLTKHLTDRLETVQQSMGKSLAGTSKETAESISKLTERLETIDKAQQNITTLSEQVVSLQHVLDDKHARGAFGEVQLKDIVEDALPPSAFGFQVTLSNGRIADCLVQLPNPPGPIAIDSKFPLTSYSSMLDADDDAERAVHARQLGLDTKKHIKDIADKYIIPGETSDSALMFLPSEAVYAELHAHHPGVIELSHKSKVYLVSPTTMMATLTTVRAVLRDVQMREQAHLIQREIGTLLVDVGRLDDRVRKLDSHFSQAQGDIDKIKISTNKINSRGNKIVDLELDDGDEAPVLPSGDPE